MKLFHTALFLVLLTPGLYAQQHYEFNRVGSPCFIKYSCYAPNEQYKSVGKAIIFVLGEPGETSDQVFQSDSLRLMSEFYTYKFYYVPNKGGSAEDKLRCLEAMASQATFANKYARENLFLALRDPEITESDLKNTGLKRLFTAVIYDQALIHNSKKEISETFEAHFETSKVYTDANGMVQELDEFATYYLDEEAVAKSSEEATPQREKPVKKYFGPPSEYNFTLSGLVRDKTTGEALPFANLSIRGTIEGTSTNADGQFTILNVPSDTSVIVVQYIGYESTEIYLSPNSPKSNLQVLLYSSSQFLQEVTVTSARQDVVLSKPNAVSVVKLTPKKLEKLPSIGEKDVMRSFQLMPGVGASNESSSGLYVRGGTPDQNLVLYDGFTIYYVDHLYGFFSAFNSNAVKDVQLYKGGFESRFGGRLSSVTEITGKDGNAHKFNLGGDISLLSVNAYMEMPIGTKISSIITYRRSYKGLLYDKIFDKFNGDEEGEEDTDAPAGPGPGGRQTQDTEVSSYFYDLNGKFTYRPNDRDIISLSIYNGEDELDNSQDASLGGFGGGDFDMSSTDITQYGNIGTSLKWARKWSDKLYGNSTLSYSNYYSERNRSQARRLVLNSDTSSVNSGVFENNDLRDFSLKSDYDYKLANDINLQGGVFGTLFNVRYTYAQNDTSTLLNKSASPILAGAYLQSNIRVFSDRINILPGVRTNWYQGTNKIYVEPRFSLMYLITSDLSLKATTGKFYQYINQVTREDILSGGKDFWLMANGSSIPVSSANHYILGLSHETKQYLYSVEAYYKTINNLTEYSLRFNPSPTGTSYDENFYSGKGIAQGIEFLAQRKYGILNGWASYTLASAQNQFDVYSDSYFSANQDVSHEFKVVGIHSYKRWTFSATWIYASGRPYTAPAGAYTVTLLDGTQQDYYTVTAKNGLRLPAYHRADIAINYKLLGGVKGDTKRKEIGNIGFSIFNIYNRKNVWYKTYTIEDQDILETNVNYLGFTPNLSLTLKLR